jgi:hypothetical protein
MILQCQFNTEKAFSYTFGVSDSVFIKHFIKSFVSWDLSGTNITGFWYMMPCSLAWQMSTSVSQSNEDGDSRFF